MTRHDKAICLACLTLFSLATIWLSTPKLEEPRVLTLQDFKAGRK